MVIHQLVITLAMSDFTALPINNFVSKLSKDTKCFQQNLELVQNLVQSPVKARHWETILCSSGNKVINTNVLTIVMMINLKVSLLHYNYIHGTAE